MDETVLDQIGNEEGYTDDTGVMSEMHDVLDSIVEQAIEGNESIEVTSDMYTAYGVLTSSGVVNAFEHTGAEGFFSSIGNGIKAAWDWVVGVWKSIWNFFFGGGKDDIEDAAEDVKKDSKDAKDLLDGKKSDAETAAAAAGVVSNIAKEGEKPSEGEISLQAAVDDLFKGVSINPKDPLAPQVKKMSKADQVKIIQSFVKHMAKQNGPASDRLEKPTKTIIASNDNFIAFANQNIADDKFKNYPIYKTLVAFVGVTKAHMPLEVKFNDFLKSTLSAFSAERVFELGTKIPEILEKRLATMKNLVSHRSEIDSAIKDVGNRIAALKDGKKVEGEDGKKLREELSVLKAMSIYCSKVTNHFTGNSKRLSSLNNQYLKAIGL